MNNTLKILATAIPMTFLAGCDPNQITFEEIEVRKYTPPGTQIEYINILCKSKSNKPIMITSVSINGRTPYVPITTEPPSAYYSAPIEYIRRWRVEGNLNGETAVVLPCRKGQRELFLGNWPLSNIPEERMSVVDVTIQTKDRGWVKYEF
jgi:hypothetical protein